MTLEELKKVSAENGIIFLTDKVSNPIKNDLYIKVRKLEGRLLDDSLVSKLPSIPNDHPLKWEWEVRKKNTARLIEYLKKKKRKLNILDIGCGNGWMSNLLSQIPDSYVFALDLNLTELEQGVRVFSKSSNLNFLFADIYESPLPENSFDIITVASLIQYFPNLSDLFERFLKLINQNGEIHILDSPLYKKSQVEEARNRTKAYYKKIGLQEMSEFYYHHSSDELKNFKYEFLYKPSSIKKNLIRNVSPFPWIRIWK